jgi:T-complex protein 1 subunit delta
LKKKSLLLFSHLFFLLFFYYYYHYTEKGDDVRMANVIAARAVANCVRTSLGPKGMDKMITSSKGEVIITNDGATILKKMEVQHPAGKMLVDLSRAQDVEAGDGTTSVVVLAGALLKASQQLLDKGIHPSIIAEAWLIAQKKSMEFLKEIAVPVDLSNKEELIKSAVTSLNSKVVNVSSDVLAPLAVNAVMAVIDPATATNVDLTQVRVVSALGGTIEDAELIPGLVLKQAALHGGGGPSRVVNAKIGLIQYCLSAPKTNMENSIVVDDLEQIDRNLRQQRKYILKLLKPIIKSGCNVLLIQESIMRDSINELALHYLAKKKIMVVKDIKRSDVEFISNSLGCHPVADPTGFIPARLGEAKLVEELGTPGGKLLKVTGVKNPGRTVSVLVRGSNRLVIDEAARSVHDAMCVIRCLVKERFMIPGGGAAEAHLELSLGKFADELGGTHGYCIKSFARAMEVVPYTLAENAGLRPIQIVTELKQAHAQGRKTAGINVRQAKITDMLAEHVVQPLLVSSSALKLATETVRMILKIDDIVASR